MPNHRLSTHKNYVLKWELKSLPQYQISTCNNIINTKTGRVLKMTLVGYTKGYWISKKFYTLKKIRENCHPIKDCEIPF